MLPKPLRTCALLCAVSLAAPAAQAALIANWNLDETSGGIVDSTGNHVIGTATGTATYGQAGVPNGTYDLPVGGNSITVSNAAGTSINFGPRATDQYFTIGTDNNTLVQNIDRTGSFTVMGWINANTLTANTAHRIVSTGNDLTAGGGWGFGLRSGAAATTGTLRFTTFGVADNDSNTFTIAAGTWYHIAATYSNGTINYFLDGELLGGGDTSLFTNESAAGRLTIGNRLNGPDLDQVDGSLDGIRVYDTVLTAAEIQAAAIAAVPEPSIALLGGLGLLGLLRRRR